ncbi:MAG: SIR2 family protein [Candidatus Omnitrophica bacterium]|nr:SIR2 family protein [Candidatus Omnitrophota bacterium]
MKINSDTQILKCRDDKTPIYLTPITEPSSCTEPFKLLDGCKCDWLKEEDCLGPAKLRPRIEPWLTALFQSEHLSLLMGSGLSRALHQIADVKDIATMDSAKFTNYNSEINAKAKKSASEAGRDNCNIEDQIRVTNELLRGLEILAETDEAIDKKAASLRTELKCVLDDFAESILKDENELITSNEEDLEQAFNYLVSFLMSFASRTGTRDRLQIFTTNYDRIIEAGAELAGLHLLDRFVGSLAPIFRSSRLDVDMHYNPPGIRGEPRYLEGVARFTKLHGSLDWIDIGKNIRRIGLPLGAESIDPYLKAPGLTDADALQLMIYPNSAKDRETAAYPYVDLFRDFAAAICRPNSTIISYGYSFCDEHINRVIEDMLTIPSTHLVVIAHGDPLGRIMQTYKKLGRNAQITLLIGDHLGDFQTLVDNYLPKPAIDRTTFRMVEILNSRWATGQTESQEKKNDSDGGETVV